MNERSSSSRKIIVAIGMAVVVGAAGIMFGVSVHRASVVARGALAPAAVPEAPDLAPLGPLPADATGAPAQTADATPADATPSEAQRDRLRSLARDTAVPAAAPITRTMKAEKSVDVPATPSSSPAGIAASAPAVALAAEPAVSSTEDPTASDSRITTAVKSEIAADGISEDASVGVSTTNGVVALTGTLATQDAIDHLKGIAEKVLDVKSVDISALRIANT